MQIDIPQPRQIQHPPRNNPPVRHHHNHVRLHRLQPRTKLRIRLDLLRLHHRNPTRHSNPLHRRRMHLHRATHRTIRLRHHQRNLMTRSNHRLQRRHRELRRPTKHNPQTHTSSNMLHLSPEINPTIPAEQSHREAVENGTKYPPPTSTPQTQASHKTQLSNPHLIQHAAYLAGDQSNHSGGAKPPRSGPERYEVPASNVDTANSGVPQNTTFKPTPHPNCRTFERRPIQPFRRSEAHREAVQNGTKYRSATTRRFFVAS